MRQASGPRRVVVLGGGHGVASVLGAVRDRGFDLTVIVTVADDGGSSGELRRRWGGPAVGDMRRSVIALAGEDGAPARAFARRLRINRLGEHPLGNLVLHSLADAFGDLESAGAWLCGELGVGACILPATTEPISLLADTEAGRVRNESVITRTSSRIRRLRFDPERPQVPRAGIDAIEHAEWVVLGPGSLYTSVLAVAALPDIRHALASSPAQVLWICNLEPDQHETAGMTAADHLAALRSHGVRVDSVLYDSQAELHLEPSQLIAERVGATACPLRSSLPGLHDRVLLAEALDHIFRGTGERVTARGCTFSV